MSIPEDIVVRNGKHEIKCRVVKLMRGGKFQVEYENPSYIPADTQRKVIAHLSGKIRKNRIKIAVNDLVTVSFDPRDMHNGIIIYRASTK